MLVYLKNVFKVTIFQLSIKKKTQLIWNFSIIKPRISVYLWSWEIYRSTLIPKNHTYPEKFLVHLIYIYIKRIKSNIKRMLFSVCFHSERLTLVLYISLEQPEFFRVGVVPWNKDTSINISSKTQKEEHALRISESFLVDILKTAFWLRNLTHTWKQSNFCQFSKTGSGGFSPLPLFCRFWKWILKASLYIVPELTVKEHWPSD